jgi:signal transduction histidine kinase
MTPEFVRERLFKPFQTTKATGMGIGVYESSQYVSGLGGSIAVESEPGVGTRVFLRLPCVQAAGQSTAPGPFQSETGGAIATPTVRESAA